MPMKQYRLILMVNCRVILTVSATIMITIATMEKGIVITVLMRKAAIAISGLNVHCQYIRKGKPFFFVYFLMN